MYDLLGFGTSFTITHDGKRKYTIIGSCSDITSAMRKVIGNKINYLFTYNSFRKLEFYDFFLLEVYYVLKAYLELNKKDKRIKLWHIRPVNNLLKILEQQTDIHRYLSNVRIERETVIDYNRIKKLFKFKIKPHQQVVFDKFLEIKDRFKIRGVPLEGKIGSGKTFTSLALAEGLGADLKIIVCPLPTVDDAWVDTLVNEAYKEPQPYYTFTSNKEYNNEPNIICHYEALPKLLKMVNKLPHGSKMLIVDEVHKITNIKSDRGMNLLKLIDLVDFKFSLLMSGTVIRDSINELILIYKALDPKFTPKVEEIYKKLYTRTPPALVEVGRNRYALLNIKMGSDDSMKLPPLVEEDVKIKLPNSDKYLLSNVKKDMKKYIEDRTKELLPKMNDYKAIYFELRDKAFNLALEKKMTTKEEFNIYKVNVDTIIDYYNRNQLGQITETIEWVNRYERKVLLPNLFGKDKQLFREAKTIYKYLALKLLGEALGKVLNKAREECFIDMAKAIDYEHYVNSTDKKVIVFTKYIKVAETAEKILEPYSLGIYGDKTKDLAKIVEEFNENPNKTILCATFQSVGTGIRLTVANVVLMIDLPYKDYLYQQAIGRVHRLGQTETCYIYRFILDTGDKKNVSDRNVDLLKNNAELVAWLTGKNLDVVINSEINNADTKNKDDKNVDNNNALSDVLNNLGKSFITPNDIIHTNKFNW